MDERSMKTFIRDLIRRELAPIMMAFTTRSETNLRSRVQRNSSEGAIKDLRTILPYGLSSRATLGIEGLIVPINGDPTHLVLAGHFDQTRPEVAEGETALYNQFGQAVYLENGKVHVGKKTSANPAVLGDELKAFLTDLVNEIAMHTHPGNGAPPTDATTFTQILNDNVTNDTIFSQLVFLDKEA